MMQELINFATAAWPPISQYPAFLRALGCKCFSLDPPQERVPLRSWSLAPLYEPEVGEIGLCVLHQSDDFIRGWL